MAITSAKVIPLVAGLRMSGTKDMMCSSSITDTALPSLVVDAEAPPSSAREELLFPLRLARYLANERRKQELEFKVAAWRSTEAESGLPSLSRLPVKDKDNKYRKKL